MIDNEVRGELVRRIGGPDVIARDLLQADPDTVSHEEKSEIRKRMIAAGRRRYLTSALGSGFGLRLHAPFEI